MFDDACGNFAKQYPERRRWTNETGYFHYLFIYECPFEKNIPRNIKCTHFEVDSVDKDQFIEYQSYQFQNLRWQTLTGVDKIKCQSKYQSQVLTNHELYFLFFIFLKRRNILYYRDFHTAFISRFKAITFVNLVNPEIYAFFYLRKHIALSVLFANETITIESNKSPSYSYKIPQIPICSHV